ncbi:MAG: hypothetical protein PHC34_01450 [Candidatus Gastranaerophilales bacterium]|nr:hypothetical protein [Candidatus Gastranaerophilales bacterium]
MEKTTVLGVLLSKRTNTAPKFQELITKHGCIINTRLGLHHSTRNSCPMGGVILLDLIGEDQDIQALEDDLKTLPDTQIQKMAFNHE